MVDEIVLPLQGVVGFEPLRPPCVEQVLVTCQIPVRAKSSSHVLPTTTVFSIPIFWKNPGLVIRNRISTILPTELNIGSNMKNPFIIFSNRSSSLYSLALRFSRTVTSSSYCFFSFLLARDRSSYRPVSFILLSESSFSSPATSSGKTGGQL